jgi:hypothetical protein
MAHIEFPFTTDVRLTGDCAEAIIEFEVICVVVAPPTVTEANKPS